MNQYSYIYIVDCRIYTQVLESHWRFLKRAMIYLGYINSLCSPCWWSDPDWPPNPTLFYLMTGSHRFGSRSPSCSLPANPCLLSGGFQLWPQWCLISLLSETRCPLPLVLYTLETDEIVLQNTVVKCVSCWRAAHPFFSALITFNNL